MNFSKLSGEICIARFIHTLSIKYGMNIYKLHRWNRSTNTSCPAFRHGKKNFSFCMCCVSIWRNSLTLHNFFINYYHLETLHLCFFFFFHFVPLWVYLDYPFSPSLQQPQESTNLKIKKLTKEKHPSCTFTMHCQISLT